MNPGNDIDSRRAALRAQYPVWKPVTLGAWLDFCAQRHPDRPLVITNETTLSYRDVAEQSLRLAAGLYALGVRPGDRVGLVMGNYPEFVTLKFAVARLGAVAVPFNYLYRTDELRFVLGDSGCRVLVTMTRFGQQDYQGMLDDIVAGWDRTSFGARSGSESVPELRQVVLLETDGEPVRPGSLTVADLGALGDPASIAAAVGELDPHAAADMLYTSGTTGFPKGVITSHDAVLRTAYASAFTRAFEDGRRVLFSLPCYHMFGYIEGLLSVLFVGGAIIPQTAFSAEGYFAGVARHRATDMLCVPTMAVAMVESPHRRDYDLSSLRAILCGSAPAPVWLWRTIEKDFGVSEIVTGYGMTECGGAMTLTLPEDPLELTSETVGRPKLADCAGVDETGALTVYRAVDPETGQEVGVGTEGELVSRGPTTMLAYWNRPTDTAEALRNGWLHSGDLGCVRADGYLQVTGRSKELYKSGGELVMPKEIEDLLAAFDDVSQVFAIGLTDDRWGEIGCVVVIPAPGAQLTEDLILSRCRAKLARFKVPKRVEFIEAADLPTTPTGKVQKFRLIERLSAAAEDHASLKTALGWDSSTASSP